MTESLAERIAALEPGSELELAPGEHTLSVPVVITKAIRIRGAGSERTRLNGSTEGAMFTVEGGGRLELLGIGVARVSGFGSVIVVDGGGLVAAGSRIAGGVASEGDPGDAIRVNGSAAVQVTDCQLEDNAGAGLYASGAARPTVRGCTSSRNNIGIHVEGDAVAELESNASLSNRLGGIAFADRASGVVRDNRCEANRVGIFAGGNCAPRLERNRVSGSAENGVTVFGEARPTLEGNDVHGNSWLGVLVMDAAEPVVEGNRLRDNGHFGLCFRARSKGVARDNVCSSNQKAGIMCEEQAAPELVGNRCEKNVWSGIVCTGDSRPTIRTNRATENSQNGIFVIGSAQPLLEKNVLAKNAGCGIEYRGDASGSAVRNECSENPRGIRVGERAHPLLEDNDLHDHEVTGLLLDGESRAVVRRCRIRKNGRYGVYLEGSAQPSMEDCVIEQNGDTGIDWNEDAAGTVVGCISRDNDRSGAALAGTAHPVVSRCEFTRNGGSGVAVSRQAYPTLEQNTLTDNGESGIVYYFESHGVARGNRCERNKEDGIHVLGEPHPLLEANTCTDNGGRGIRVQADADDLKGDPRLVDNVCEGNKDEVGYDGRAPWPLVEERLGATPHFAHVRRAFRPIVEEGDGSPTESKFGGKPWLDKGEAWPACPHCAKSMPLVLQLDLGGLPETMRPPSGGGLLQLFYCKREGCADFGNNRLVRVAKPQGKPRSVRAPKLEHAVSPKRIVSWLEFGELPRWLELETLGLSALPAEMWKLGFRYWDGSEEGEADGPSIDARLGDKLGGWPCWVMEREVPRCPTCQTEMTHLFQIDAEDNVPWSWGDAGCAWILRCPEHQDSLELVWQCH